MEEKKVPEIKRDYKMKLMVWGVWFTLCFAAGVLLSFLFVNKKAFPDFTQRLLVRIGVSVVLGIVIEIILLGFVFPVVLNKDRKHLKETLTRINNEGYTPQVMYLLDEGYASVVNSDTRTGYANSYALYLCDAYISERLFDRALYYNSLVNTEELFRYSSIGLLFEQLLYYGQRIQLAAFTGNIPACEQVMRESQNLFSASRGKNPMFDYIMDGSTFEYFFAVGDLARCEALVRPYEQYFELKYSVYNSLGRIYAKKGDTYAANQFFNKALLAARNDYLKQIVERERLIAVNGG